MTAQITVTTPSAWLCSTGVRPVGIDVDVDVDVDVMPHESTQAVFRDSPW
ncbi:MAG: hypothetical protein OXF72_10620 [Gammaproteobacteria bacterium]|nr:hypothetical protein [Gammaproteobacteria bacterium]